MVCGLPKSMKKKTLNVKFLGSVILLPDSINRAFNEVLKVYLKTIIKKAHNNVDKMRGGGGVGGIMKYFFIFRDSLIFFLFNVNMTNYQATMKT